MRFTDRFAKIPVLSILLVSFVAGCAHEGGRVSETSSAPNWVRRAACADSSKKVICAVGSANNIPDLSLAMQTADLRARANVAQELEAYVSILSKSYENSVAGGDDMKRAAAEQEATSTMKGFTEETLRGVDIVDHFKDSDGTVYSKAQIDLATVKTMLHEYRDMSARMKKDIEKHADSSFDELKQEEAAHKR